MFYTNIAMEIYLYIAITTCSGIIVFEYYIIYIVDGYDATTGSSTGGYLKNVIIRITL